MDWIEPPTKQTSESMLDLHPLVTQALRRKGIVTSEQARAFLDPDFYTPSPPTSLPGVDAAVARLKNGISRGERICVWGDFDVDGQTATSVLISALRACKADTIYHLPIRATEGHGMRIPQVEEIIDQGAELILTCDTGITSKDAIEFAKSRGVETIITDHHDLPERLPEVVALVNPKLLPEAHPLSDLAGAGVAFLVAKALLESSPLSDLDPNMLLDLVALGMIGDLASLRGDTRYLVQRGMQKLRSTGRVGLQIMGELAQVSLDSINEEHVGFELTPRLNALGRLGDANPAVELLTTSDPVRARVLATQLEGYNAQRKLLSAQVYQAAESMLHANPEILAMPIIMLSHPEWHGGVIGIVAARIARRYGKPTILFSTAENGLARGSARSIEGLHITQAISSQRNLLVNYGGHPMAAGLSLDIQNLESFKRRIVKVVERMIAESDVKEAAVQVDAWMELPELNFELADEIELLAPFGPGNDEPILATRDLELRTAVPIGRMGEHLRLDIQDASGYQQQVLWWNGAGEILPESRFDLAFTLRGSDFRGSRKLSLEFVDYRARETPLVVVRQQPPEILDWRMEEHPELKINQLLTSPSSIEIWTEAAHREVIGGSGRQELEHAEILVIWTAPPSRLVLQTTLERVNPRKIIVVAKDPKTDDPKIFLERLGGFINYLINKRHGRAKWAELAAATSQREETTRLGIEWFVEHGQLGQIIDNGDDILLSRARGNVNVKASEEILEKLEKMLRETSAYRSYFIQTGKPVE